MATRLVSATTLFLLIIVVTLGVTGIVLWSQLRGDTVSSAVDAGESLRLLLTIHDGERIAVSSVVLIDTQTRRVGILDIPGNVGVLIPWLDRIDRIDVAFAEGDGLRYRDLVSSIVGTPLTLMAIDRDGLERLVDLLGGVDIFLATDFLPEDRVAPMLATGGTVRLDGPSTSAFLFDVDPAATELDEVGRRQAFMAALIAAFVRGGDVAAHPDAAAIRDRAIDVEWDSRALGSAFELLSSVDSASIVRRRVQGTTRTVDADGQTRQLLFPHFDGQWLRQSVQQVLQGLASPAEEAAAAARIRVEVLNGTSVAGLAGRTGERLADFGFEPVRVANADRNDRPTSVVIDRVGTGEAAGRVAQTLGIARIEVDVIPEPVAEVTVILGGDFDGTGRESGASSEE